MFNLVSVHLRTVHDMPMFCRHIEAGVVHAANVESDTVHTVCHIVQFSRDRSYTFSGCHSHRLPVPIQLG